MLRFRLPAIGIAFVLVAQSLSTGIEAQQAHISEEIRTLETYPFSEPNPVPIVARDARLYPYHSFEGYSATSRPQEWKVVHLENDLIEVFVLPEVGGKVWGAVVKETGHEFIYRNEVMKFRNIALRGPWTSGGIEFNFGVIGHTPATATPVDYTIRENEDGSVSCFVGGMDLPSRTHWRVEIRLPADKAYFETSVLWYNPTPLSQPYYNWMTGAAFAQDDLEMVIPGASYLTHPGAERDWPVDDQDRYLPLYRNNTFESHKSYHVVGELNDFFGGYYGDDDYGFGHWARYEDMPGQKLWLWALSREGGIWEDLLTDTDGQYVEFQAGRLFVQYSPDPQVNPITQASFDPMSASRWTETWFPVEGLGGLTDASRDGAMHLDLEGGELAIAVHAFGDLADTLEVWSGEERIAARAVTLTALQPLKAWVQVDPQAPYRVRLAGLDLDYRSDPEARLLSRPFATDPGAMPALPEVDRMVLEANELLKGRRHAQARELFEAAIETEPWNRDARVGLADLAYRSARLDEALDHINHALQLDAYDAEANFLAGATHRALGHQADAHDAFGWAARSVAFRSAAYAQLAELSAAAGDLGEAKRNARLAIDYDRYSVPAWRTLAILGRHTGNGALAQEALTELEALDPLHHFVFAERYLDSGGGGAAGDGGPRELTSRDLAAHVAGELPGQTLLELAMEYRNRGLEGDALALLESDAGRPAGAVQQVWRAFLSDDPTLLPAGPQVAFEFPFRPETLVPLRWAEEHSGDWAWTYLTALNLWGLDRAHEAAPIMAALGDGPDQAVFYATRGLLLAQEQGADPVPDLRRAVALEPATRSYHVLLVQRLQDAERWVEALAVSRPARDRFPADFNLALMESRSLIHEGFALEAVATLADIHVLPSEHARESHRLYEQAHTLAALDALERGRTAEAREHLIAALEWPISLGQGRPYEPEERVVQLLLGHTEARMGDRQAAAAAYEAVVGATQWPDGPQTALDLTALAALRALGRQAEAPLRAADALEAPFHGLDGRILLRALTLSEGEDR